MNRFTFFLLFLFCFASSPSLRAQISHEGHPWLIQTGLSRASDNDLGDNGIQLNTRIIRNIGKRFNASANIGAFHMTGVNEDLKGDAAVLTHRSMSFFNIDLLAGVNLIQKEKVRLELAAGGSFRNYRQIYPQFVYLSGGSVTSIQYNVLRDKEVGYSMLCGFDFRIKDNVWLGVEANTHGYSFFGQVVGGGVRITVGL